MTTNRTRYANQFYFIKVALLLIIYTGLYFILLFSEQSQPAFFGMVLMGPMAILIGINVAHDAAHGTISPRKMVNKSFLLLFDILGANSYIWKRRHVYSHHSFPNIMEFDADLKQNPFVRIFPKDKWRPLHQYQNIYAPFLYLFYTINWLYIRDFQDFFVKRIGSLQQSKHPVSEIFRLIFFKSFYIFYILILPLIFSSLTNLQVFYAFILMNFTASITITLALIPSHVSEHSNFPLPDEDGRMRDSWSHHQLKSITDFSTGNWFLNFLFGGFNHHIAHHLFPKYCHIHATHITPIVKATAAEFGLPYQHEASFINAYLSHYRLLKNNGMVYLNQVLE